MPIIPHAHWFFDVVGLLLRADDESSDWAMTADEAVRYVDAIGEFVPADRRDRTGIFASPLPVLLLGGDPIGRLDDLDPILWRLNSFGLAAEVSTTAAWVEDRAQVEEVLTHLRQRVYALRLSTDADALTGTRGDRLNLLLEVARELGIVVDIHCTVAPGRPVPRKLLALEVINNNSSFVHFDPVYDGPADDTTGYYLSAPTRQRCAEKFGFYVVAGGSVYPCLAGAGSRHDALRIGDLTDQSVAEIVGLTKADAGLVRLREQGPRHLYAQVGSASGRYADNCDFHLQHLRGPR